MATAGPSSDLEQLSLLPYLSASPFPTVVFPAAPLLEALAARTFAFAPSRSSADSGTEVLAMPGAGRWNAGHAETAGGSWGIQKEEERQAAVVIGSLLPALQPAWTNDAWKDLERGWRKVPVQGKGKGRARDEVEGAEAEMADGRAGGSGTEYRGQLAFLSREEQGKVLSLLLDTLEAAERPSRSRQPSSRPPPVQVNSISLSATFLPSHVVLVGVTTVASTASSTSPFVYPIRQALPPLVLSKQPSFAPTSRAQLNPASFPPLPSPTFDLYLEFLGTTHMGCMIRNFPWHTSSIGPIAQWGPELKTLVSCMLASPFREAILFGPDHVIIYNDHYIGAAGQKHPELLGKTMREGWGNLWEELGPVAESVMRGEIYSVENHFLPMDRNGYVEETYHTFAYIPFRDASSDILGFINVSFETTASVIAARRLATVRDIVQSTSLCRTVTSFCSSTLESLATNVYDLPFLFLYTSEVTTNQPLSSREIRLAREKQPDQLYIKLTRQGAIGVPDDHPFSPSDVQVDLTPILSRHSSSSHSSSTLPEAKPRPDRWSWPFEEACMRREPVFVENLRNLTAKLEQRGWEERPRHAVVIPVFAEAGQKVPQAVLVVGINSRGNYDLLYATFLQLVARHVAIGLLAVSNTEAEARRSAELLSLDRAKSSFFQNVSHELRTPLTLVLGPLADVLAHQEQLSTVNRNRLLTVQRHANRLLTMVNKLLDFSSLEGGRIRAQFRPVNLGALTRDLATLFRDAIERGKITYIISCDEDPPDSLPIYLSPELWEKVVFNLIGNSFKYCFAGEIEVSVRSTLAEAVVSVRDTGVGIPQAELGHIFERFHRVEGTSRTATGTGIGLALTLEIVKLLGGELEVQSEVGKGSTFSVRFPRGFTHLPIEQVKHEAVVEIVKPAVQRNLSIIEEAASWRFDMAVDRDTPNSSASSSGGSVSGSGDRSSHGDYLVSTELLNLKDCTVLLADDSNDIRSYVASILSKSFNVVQVADGQAALEYALQSPPSLIVTDVMMPRLDGRGLLAALRANPTTALTPVLFLSAQAGAEARAEALEAGADDYLVKPFQARELVARVNTHLQLARMRAELEKRVRERTSALIESEARYRGLADRYSTLSLVSPVGIFMTDEKGNISYANPRWHEISGHPLEKPLSEWRDSILPSDLERTEASWNAAINGSLVEHCEFHFQKGNWVTLELRAFHDVSSGSGFVGAVTDITIIKKAEAITLQIVEQRALDAEENRRNQEQFIDMASHELRNPLSGVWQNAELLSSSLLHISALVEELREGHILDRETLKTLSRELEENLEAAGAIILCATHQGRIADDILNVSKLQYGLLTISPLPLDLTAKVKEVLRMFEVECIQKEIALSLAMDDSVAALNAEWIFGDGARISQILINMLSNAVRYTAEAQHRRIVVHVAAYAGPPPTNERSLRVAEPQFMELSTENVWIVVGVEDSGKGLSSAELDRLFARFAQANPKSDQYGGSGLGLYVSKKLVELHSGFIEVESAPGRGSIFRFAIPAARAPSEPAGMIALPPPSEAPSHTGRTNKRPASNLGRTRLSSKSAKTGTEAHSTQEETASSASPPPAPLHVLVVEDNLINQKVMVRQLKLADFFVTVAGNGQEALDLLLADQSRAIDVVLMDIEMPVMDGLTAIRELRRLEASGVVPVHYGVIAVTGNARQGQIDACREAGFDDVAIKPYRMAELLVQIQKLLEKGEGMD